MSRIDIYSERVNRGLTQRELAAACGVSLTVIQRLERGGDITPAKAKQVADYFGVKAVDLLPARDAAA